MTNRIVGALEHSATKLGKTLGEDAGKAVKDLYHSTGHNLTGIAEDTAAADAKHAKSLRDLLRDGKDETPSAPHAPGEEGHLPHGDGPSAVRRHAEQDPHGNTRPGNSVSGCGDPVDVATGRMFLSQRDIVLPGALPLVFVRRTDSGYGAGRWFGASWSSTVDQRLEVDGQGVIFVHEVGLLLSYPVPVPGEPVLPAQGPRWPLTLGPDGTYAVRDTDDDRSWTFARPESGIARLTTIGDRNGHRITFEYDEKGAPAKVVHDGGYEIKVLTHDGRVEALHLAGAGSEGTDVEIVRYGYDGGRLTEVVNSSGLPLCFGYDDAGRIDSWTDRNDHSYRYTYDEYGRCVAQTGVGGHLAYRFDYGDREPATGLRTTTVTDSLGEIRRYLVNNSFQVVAETDPLGHEISTERDPQHRVLSVTDALGRTEAVAYDEGRPTVFTRPDGRVVKVAYNALGLPAKVVDADGSIWQREYDRRGNLLATADPAGAVSRRTYDERGHLTSLTDALGHTTTVVCDAAGLPVRITDPLGAETVYERDAFGRPTAVIDPLGAVTRTEWTVEGRPARRIGPDGASESWTYDGEGNCLTHADQLGTVTRCTYGPFNLLTSVVRPDGARHTFAHDMELRLRTVVNPAGLSWQYDYDPGGRLVCERDFHGRTLRYTHDPAGRLAGRTNALGQTTRYTYDSLGHLGEIAADGSVTSFTRDLLGRPTAAVNADHRLAWTYDDLGRVLSETVDDRPALTFSYDARGSRTGRTTPSGAVSSWSHDPAGRPTALTVGDRTLAFMHDAAGRETGRRLDASLTWDNVYDPAGRTTSQTVAAAHRVISGRAYTYREDGYVTAVDEYGSGRRDYTMDGAGRITAVTARNWTETYAYDATGQQTHAAWNVPGIPTDATGPRTLPSGTAGTRIATAGRVRYEYDAQGRVVLRQKSRISRPPETWRYTWDAYDRLAGVTTPDGVRWRYRYDPLGRRTTKERLVPDGSVAERTDFTWDGPLLVEQSAHHTGRDMAVTLTWDHRGLLPLTQRERISATSEPHPEPGPPVSAVSGEEIDSRFFAIVTDVIGTPTALVDSAGGIAWQSVATLWGTTVWSTASTAYTPLRFPGQYHDVESGLHYNVHRYYDPATAQYTSPDPLGLSAGPSPMSYVHNPLRAADPLGLKELPLGEKANPFTTRQDAERAAFDLGGIPHDEQPIAQWSIGADPTRRGNSGYVYNTNETHWGEMRQYETENGSVVIVEHTHDPAGSHFHVGRAKPDGTGEPRNFVNFGWNGQDPVEDEFERYLKTDKPGGDHHLFYRGGVVCPG